MFDKILCLRQMSLKDKVFRNYSRNKSKNTDVKRLKTSKTDKECNKLKVKGFAIQRKSKIYQRIETVIQEWLQLLKEHITKTI